MRQGRALQMEETACAKQGVRREHEVLGTCTQRGNNGVEHFVVRNGK